MKPSFALFFIALAFVAAASADTGKITIQGMHCGGCKKMVTKNVCEDAALKSDFESCEITDLDTKTQIGTLVVKTKKNTPVNFEGIEKAVLAVGENYKITKKETVK